MPLTTLDSTAALILIDLQQGVVGLPTIHPVADIVGRAARLARAFRARTLPVALVNVAGLAPGRTDVTRPRLDFPPDWVALVPEMDPQPGDLVVTKQRVGAFIGTGLDAELRGRGVTQVCIAGIATGGGVESTARSAYDHGYHVVLVVDAMTDLDAEVHRHSVERIFPRIGETATTDEVLKALAA